MCTALWSNLLKKKKCNRKADYFSINPCKISVVSPKLDIPYLTKELWYNSATLISASLLSLSRTKITPMPF